jgi:hypothetical protein
VFTSEHHVVGLVIVGLLFVMASSAFGEIRETQRAAKVKSAAAATPKVVAVDQWKRCGKIRANPSGHFVVRKKGRVTCRGARKLMHLFLNEGQGVKHGGPSSAETYYTLYGWRCGTGAGGGGCVRHRGRDRTQAYWVA